MTTPEPSAPRDDPAHGGPREDRDLRQLVATVDPAAELVPLLPAERGALLTRVRRAGGSPVSDLSMSIGRVARRRRWVLAAAGALVAASVAVGIGVTRPAAGPDAGAPPVVLTLTLPVSDPMAMCARVDDPVSRQVLGQAEVAFSGVVTAAGSGQVELRPDHFFRGGPADTVRLATSAPGSEDATRFEVGGRYLVAASAGTVLECGLSETDSPALRSVYEQVFA